MEQVQLTIPKTALAKLMDIFGLAAMLILIGYTAWQFGSLPDTVPGHYNAAGEVTRFGSKWEIWLLPIVGVVMWLVLHVLEKYPHTFNYLNLREDNREQQYRNGKLLMNFLKNECVILFAVINFISIETAFGRADGLSGFFLPVFLLVLFGTMGYFVIRMLRL